MMRTNEELDALIAEQEAALAVEAGLADTQRGHVSKALGQLAKNRAGSIRALEGRKAVKTVNLKAGI